MYVIACVRLDLAQTISEVRKFLSNPGRSHWDAVKWVFIYLRRTRDYGIMFNRQ